MSETTLIHPDKVQAAGYDPAPLVVSIQGKNYCPIVRVTYRM